MNALIIAAEAALVELKLYHNAWETEGCPGIPNCPVAAAIANLEAEIARTKLEEDPEFQAVAGMEEHDVANAILLSKGSQP